MFLDLAATEEDHAQVTPRQSEIYESGVKLIFERRRLEMEKTIPCRPASRRAPCH